jgi:hypothetical protein
MVGVQRVAQEQQQPHLQTGKAINKEILVQQEM